jgi:hypothetical protein
MPIRKPQVKLIEETNYGVEPTYPSDHKGVIVLDPISFSVTPNQNLQTVETLSAQDISDVALGDYKYTGNIEFPIRISQLPFVNYIGLGTKFVTPVYSGAQDTDNDGIIDTYAEITNVQYVSIPTVDKLPSFTIYSLESKPQVIRNVFGSVFTDYKISINKGKITNATFNYGARINKDKYDVDDPAIKDTIAVQLPLTQGDLAASQDIGLYRNIQIIDVDPDSGVTIPSGLELIDVIYTTIPNTDGTENSIPSKVIVGEKFIGVKSLNLNISVTNYTDDSTRIGDRFSQEFGMTTVQRLNYTADITADYITTEQYSELIDKYLGRNTADITTDEWSPNQVDYGDLSLVAKFGSPKDIRDKNKDPTTHSYDFVVDDTITTYTQEDLAALSLSPKGSQNRGIMIMPNVVLNSLSDITKQVGTIPELKFNAMLLPDKVDGPFSDLTIEYATDETYTGTSKNELNVAQQKIVAITHLKI